MLSSSEFEGFKDAMLTLAYKQCNEESDFAEMHAKSITEKVRKLKKHDSDEYMQSFLYNLTKTDRVSDDLVDIVKNNTYNDVISMISDWEENDYVYKSAIEILNQQENWAREYLSNAYIIDMVRFMDDFSGKQREIIQKECVHSIETIKDNTGCYDREQCTKCNKVFELIELKHTIVTNRHYSDCYREECVKCKKILTPWRWKDKDGNWTGTRIYAQDSTGQKIDISPSFEPLQI
jgi:hypothetical protein